MDSDSVSIFMELGHVNIFGVFGIQNFGTIITLVFERTRKVNTFHMVQHMHSVCARELTQKTQKLVVTFSDVFMKHVSTVS